jgi:hypothetical protein
MARRFATLLVLALSTPVWADDAPKMLPPKLVEGHFGKALDARATPVFFDGDERYRTPPLTVECWAKLFSKKGVNAIVACDAKESARHWEIYSDAGSGVFSAYLTGTDGGEIKSKVDICDEKWHYLAMTFDGAMVRLFVDGNKVTEQAAKPKNGLKPVPGSLTIGQVVEGKKSIGCDGLIDDVRISHAVRTIKATPDAALLEDPLTVGVWRFDRPEGLLVGDPLWTPPAPTGPAADWEKQTDKDWVDGRLRKMDTGLTWNATFDYPTWEGKAKVYKGTAIRIGDKGEAGVLFDRGQLRVACGWMGPFLNQSDRRFGLLNTPTPSGHVVFCTSSGPGWADRSGTWESKHPATASLPREWAQFNGMYCHGQHTVFAYTVNSTLVLESPWVESEAGVQILTRTINVAPSEHNLTLLACEFPAEPTLQFSDSMPFYGVKHEGLWTGITITGDGRLNIVNGKRGEITIPKENRVRRIKVLIWQSSDRDLPAYAKLAWNSPPPASLSAWHKPGNARWTKEIVTRGEIGKGDGPFAVDTLTLPYDNPHNALFFVSGHDFLPNGDLALCTAHGDVWIVKGIDDKLNKLTWKRFATGLYQPLGLKLVDGKIVVLERGQLTRLHDLNGDGEADFYECLSNDWHTGAGEHSFDTCLETDRDGNFYFFKTGDPETPTGGCLLRVGKDGGKATIFATGFRHPIGLGVSPDGLITGADQEGNWMPMTRLDVYQKGGFYGDMRTHHREIPPKIYDPPLLWLPKEADNSAGGQVWVPEGKWGPLSKQMLHLSYGRCKLFLVMPQKVGDVWQGGAVDLGLTFLSGTMRGRFGPDGHLYVSGLRGWQTAAVRDGCLQRVRYTGKPLNLPVALSVHADGVQLKFAEELDRKSVEEMSRWRVEQWGYRWSADYGSKHWSVADPKKEGHDAVTVEAVTLSEDRKSVFLRIKDVKAVMQMGIGYDVRTAAGAPMKGTVYNTIHQPAPRQ